MPELLNYLFSLPAESVDVGYRFASIYQTDDDGDVNLLHLLARSGNGLEVIRHLVLVRGMDICEADSNGYLPIYWAISFRKPPMGKIQIFLEQHIA